MRKLLAKIQIKGTPLNLYLIGFFDCVIILAAMFGVWVWTASFIDVFVVGVCLLAVESFLAYRLGKIYPHFFLSTVDCGYGDRYDPEDEI